MAPDLPYPDSLHDEDSLLAELVYLDQLLDLKPQLAARVMRGLGELGTEAYVDLPRLMVERAERLTRRHTHFGGRVAAVAALIATAPGLMPAAMAAPGQAPVAIRVLDAVTREPLPDAIVTTADDRVLSQTDARGEALVPAERLSEPVLVIKRKGYRLLVVDAGQHVSQGAIALERLNAPGALAFAPIILPEQPAPVPLALGGGGGGGGGGLTLSSGYVGRRLFGATYTVRPGDSLSAIASRALGGKTAWKRLLAANRDRIANPAHLPVALVLRMPAPLTAPSADATTHVVRRGDSLSRLAKAYLGDARRWPELFAANKHQLLHPSLLRPGQRLVLPKQADRAAAGA